MTSSRRRARRDNPPVVVADRPVAERLPIARVAVDMPQPHLDRLFDYLVPAADDEAAQPGVRVRVRFSGRLRSGYLIERAEKSDHTGRLMLLQRVVSAEQVLTPVVADLARAVADRYVGTLADVLRLAIPPRHARVEAEVVAAAVAAPQVGGEPAVVVGPVADAEPGVVAESGPAAAEVVAAEPAAEADPVVAAADAEPAAVGPWDKYEAGSAFLTALSQARPVRAVWQALPGEDWPARLAEAAHAAWSAGRGAVIVVPDARDLARLAAAVADVFSADDYVLLSADLGPTQRYRSFLRLVRGQTRVVIGTRAAAFAPVTNPGLCAVFDDGDDSLADPRAPYPHAREVLMMRAAREQSALLVGGFSRTAEGQLLVDSGWAKPLVANRSTVRLALPRISASGEDYAIGADSAAAAARISPAAFAAARRALAANAPVLLQVPRRGYAPALACARCRRPARCRRCSGPLALTHSARTPSCGWCGVATPRWACAACAASELRMTAIGAGRTAEEIGRAFPGVRLVLSAGDKIVDVVDDEPAIIVATPGAEPVAVAGYGAALLLDGWALLGWANLRATEETLRRWMSAVALVRSAADGGAVVVGADAGLPVVQALIRWDAAGHAATELAGRRELGFPPAAAMASLTGSEPTVLAALTELELPDHADVLGPVPVTNSFPRSAGGSGEEPELVRGLVRLPLGEQKTLTAALRVLRATRSVRSDSSPLRIEVDPRDIG